jgi:LysM repeat protein
MTVTAAPAAVRSLLTWVVRPGETLSGIAAALRLRGGWPALYAVNRRVIGADPDVIRPGTALAVPGTGAPLSYTVAPGDTLSAVAAALGVRGGWRALYAANRRVIGPDPGLIRPGAVLAVPGQATSGKAPAGTSTGTGPGGHRAQPARGGQPHGPAAGGTPIAHGTAGGRSTAGGAAGKASTGAASPGGTVQGSGAGNDGAMPRWLKATLLVVAALAVASFIAQPAVAVARHRRRDLRARAAARRRDRGQRTAARMARVIQADHERLIVTYSISDDTVYLLTPPGEDPSVVLRAARLVLPEDTYEDLADHLGVPSGWQRE